MNTKGQEGVECCHYFPQEAREMPPPDQSFAIAERKRGDLLVAAPGNAIAALRLICVFPVTLLDYEFCRELA